MKVIAKSVGINIGISLFTTICLSISLAKADSLNFNAQKSGLTETQKAEAKESAQLDCEGLAGFSADVKIIRTISENNRYKVICREIDPPNKLDHPHIEEASVTDHLIMPIYQPNPDSNDEVEIKANISIYFTEGGIKTVDLYQFYSNSEKMDETSFLIDGRKFYRWDATAQSLESIANDGFSSRSSRINPLPKVVKEYQKAIKQILNTNQDKPRHTQDNNPREELDITF